MDDKLHLDKFLLRNFVEYLVENYDIASARVRWITHGTDAPHSFVHNETGAVKLVEEIAEDYAREKDLILDNAFDSKYLGNL